MSSYFHSITLDYEKCMGCTNCIKRCPTEAIRVRGAKAEIIGERCIDCGECIQVCPYNAKIAVTDTLDKLSEFKYKIALPGPPIYAQFKEEEKVENILNAFLEIGFDDVFEVALAEELLSFMTRHYLSTNKHKKPLISSYCPAILRLMQIKFPDLLCQVSPFITPGEISARLAKEEAVKRTGIAYKDIGAFAISRCPARVTEIRQPMVLEASAVDGVISISLVYKDLLKQLTEHHKKEKNMNLQKATGIGMSWGYIGGEASALNYGSVLAVCGIQNVTSVLEEVERGEFKDVDFLEFRACTGGCVGGPLSIQNPFVGTVKLKKFVEKYRTKTPYYQEKEMLDFYQQGRFVSAKPILPRPIMMLDEEISKALHKVERLDKITSKLPGLDCGACGAPSCRALAEDIIRGIAVDTDCIIKLREKGEFLTISDYSQNSLMNRGRKLTLQDIKELLDAEVLFGYEQLSKEVNSAFVADLLSDVLAFATSGSLLITGLTNPQVIRTAELLDIAAVIIGRGKSFSPEALELARESNIPILTTKLILFEISGRLYARGIRGCIEKVGSK
ncbi:MAG: [Fe-Fe] hydrogenase large subunit C-terminal domain-containing protein [Pseudomonadota bacterium]